VSEELLTLGFERKNIEGLGLSLVCKICQCIFISPNDALRHLQLYHRIFSSTKLEKVLQFIIKDEEKEERKREEGLLVYF
jgi:hypothetical protein